MIPDKTTTYRAALASSERAVLFAIENSTSTEKPYVEKKDFSSGASGKLASWLMESLAKNSIGIDSIRNWTISTGPGGFSVLRVISSLVAGITFNKPDVRVRGLPGSFAIASAVSRIKGDGLYCIIAPAYNKTNFFHSVMISGNSAESVRSGIMKSSELHDFVSNHDAKFVSMESYLEKFKDLCPTENIFWLKDYPVEEMLHILPDFWSRESLKDLIYLRPPVDSDVNE